MWSYWSDVNLEQADFDNIKVSQIRGLLGEGNMNVHFVLYFNHEAASFSVWAKQLLHMFGSGSCKQKELIVLWLIHAQGPDM